MSSVAPANVRGAFAALRAKLIDKTLRNRMINYRVPSARSAVGLEIKREHSLEIWKSLVVGRKKFGFTGPADPKKEDDQDTYLANISENDTTDLLLYTPTPKTKRESRLIATYKGWYEQLEERGVNCLYLTLGMLEWKEPGENQTHRAPLVLIPVALERTSRGEVKLSYEDGEISTNLSLKAKLQEYSLELPDIPSDFDTFDPVGYFDEVKSQTESMEQWVVHHDEVALNFFSFEKIALYVDLDAETWPDGSTPLSDSNISAILGDGYPAGDSPFNDDTNIDEVRTPEDSREVFEADSSQILVILEAGRGTSMVVEGPPGTGKSQTIANLIADLVSRGKRVLFVSEKMTALEVVYRRLEDAGLGDASLKLHGQKTNRRTFYEEIGRTWSLQSRLADSTQNLIRLTELRNALNHYVSDLHQPLEPYAVSPRRLLSLACALPKATDEDFDSGYDGTPLRDVNWETMERRREDIRLIQAKVRQMGIPSSHPFWGSAIEFFGPDERHVVERDLASTQMLLNELIAKSRALADQLKVAPPANLSAVSMLHRCVDVALTAPPLDGMALEVDTWRKEEAGLRECFDALVGYQSAKVRLSQLVVPSALDQDWTVDHGVLLQKGGSLLGRWSKKYRLSAAKIAGSRISGTKTSPADVKSLVVELMEAQRHRESVRAYEALVAKLYGVQWKGLASDPSNLRGLLEWVLQLEGQVSNGTLPPALLDFFTGNLQAEGLREESAEVARLESEATQMVKAVREKLKYSSANVTTTPFDGLQAKIRAWSDNVSRLPEIVGWNLLAKEMRDRNLVQVLILAARWPHASELLESHVVRHWAHAGISRAFQSRPSLANFERMRQEETIREFRRLDNVVLQHNRSKARHAHLAGLPQHGQVGLTAELNRQCALRRGHKSIRSAFEKYRELILQIKPVCMMSPMSVAAFLPRYPRLFDVVIFDEASQVKPEDAMSAIARAGQLIVVGDSKQMPPTSFFDSLVQDDVDEDAEYDMTIGKMESVLALCSAAVQNTFRRHALRWHYRSLHQSLIQTSNHLFYQDRLVVFPSAVYSAEEASSQLGLRFRYNPNAVYDRGSARKVNLIQAEEIAQAAIKQISERPYESLMIVAFSKDQQKAIQDILEQIQEPGLLAEYTALHPYEKFEVKNLETAQGDERDVVLISIGYGRDAKGALWMNFGPISTEDGGRRLNVLMSRSKKRMEVFSSIRGADISVNSGRETGVTALKVFLDFAETGILEERNPTGQDPDSDFEVQVKEALERHGFSIDCQVGTAGFRIDLAVRHPDKPGTYLLGIECDGATYHSARSARDRDKLRQLILESRGWTLHRIWSTDWWTDRDGAVKRALSAIEQALEASGQTEINSLEVVAPQKVEDLQVWTSPPVVSAALLAPYQAWRRPFDLQGYAIHELPMDVLARCVETVVAFEGPIHEELLIKRVRESAGFGRAGDRMKFAILASQDFSIRRGEIRKSGQFLHWKDEAEIKARSRETLPSAERRFDWIAPEEIDDAILATIRAAHSATEPQVAEGVRRAFGFGRTPDELAECVSRRLEGLRSRGQVQNRAEQFYVE